MGPARRPPFSRWFAPETLVQSLGLGLVLTVLSRLAGLGRGVLFARLMDRAELGLWAIMQNTMQMLSVVLILGIPAGLCRYVVRYERDGVLRPFLGRVLGVSLAVGVVLCAAGVLFRELLAQQFFEDETQISLAILLCLGGLALMALNVIQGLLQGLRVYRINALMLVAQSVGFAGLGAILLTVWQPTALAGAWAFLIVSVLVTAVPCWMLWSHHRAGTSAGPGLNGTELWRPLLWYSLGTWGSSAMFSLWGWLDRYMLIHIDTLGSQECLRQLGSYYIVDNITAPLLGLFAGWSVQVQAHTVHLWETKRQQQAGDLVQMATKLTVLVVTAVAACAILFKQFLLVNIFGDTSLASSKVLELGLATACWLSAQCMVRCFVLCRERVWSVSVVWGSAVALSCVCNLVLIPMLHLQGAAITAAATALFSTWLLMGFTHRVGLPLARSTWLSTLIPLLLLLPPHFGLAGLGLTALLAARTEWLLTMDERQRLRAGLLELLSRRMANTTVAAA